MWGMMTWGVDSNAERRLGGIAGYGRGNKTAAVSIAESTDHGSRITDHGRGEC